MHSIPNNEHPPERYELLVQREEDALRIEARQKLALHNDELALRAKMAGAHE